jgi:hypothetical protein
LGFEDEFVVSKHLGVFREPPKKVPSDKSVDGPLMGNGDVGVVLAGPPEELVFYIGKNDFWSRILFRPLPVGGITIRIPELVGASYYVEQDMLNAEVRGHFVKGDCIVRSRSWIHSSDNLLVTELSFEGDKSIDVCVDLWTVKASYANGYPDEIPRIYPTGSGTDGSQLWITRHAEPVNVKGISVAVATCFLGVYPKTSNDGDSKFLGDYPTIPCDGNSKASASFQLEPKQKVIIVSKILSSRDVDADLLASAKKGISEMDVDELDKLKAEHREWWRIFWSKSFIEIADKRVESYWYGAQYILACSNREGKIAPGLWGNWITTDYVEWFGDYHLNYNFQSPYFGVYSSNHAELAAPYYDTILDFVPMGRKMAREFFCRGIHFPCAVGPYRCGIIGNWIVDHGQRSNAVFAAINFINHYYYTQDIVFLREKAYPFMLAVADFWEDYLKRDETGRYVVYNSNTGEKIGSRGCNTNSIIDLAFIRFLFKGILVASKDLGVDDERRPKWQDIQDNLSDFPTKMIGDKKVFCWSEDEPIVRGISEGYFFGEGIIALWPIMPGGNIDLRSSKDLLEISHNTLNEVRGWRSYNGIPTVYPSAVRVGYPNILSIFSEVLQKDMTPNFYVHQGGGGIETCGATLAVNVSQYGQKNYQQNLVNLELWEHFLYQAN